VVARNRRTSRSNTPMPKAESALGYVKHGDSWINSNKRENLKKPAYFEMRSPALMV
jgi:hypothetical protein